MATLATICEFTWRVSCHLGSRMGVQALWFSVGCSWVRYHLGQATNIWIISLITIFLIIHGEVLLIEILNP